MATAMGSLQSSRNSTRPAWLQIALADLDEKMKKLALNLPEEEDTDSFAERAESYYRKRPQLLTLLQDLYNGYLSLADRYCLNLTKHHHQPSQILTFSTEDVYEDSDAESSLSYQPPTATKLNINSEAVIAELVTKSVDYDILLHEVGNEERSVTESSRKIELQKSLLEVLESERLILLNENARLGYQVSALAEQNKGLMSESVFMKRKASELARCVFTMRDDHRVCLLSRRIELLQGQIYGLEKRNKECYEQQLIRTKDLGKEMNSETALEVCFEVEMPKTEKNCVRLRAPHGGFRTSSSRWWDRVKISDLFLCGSHPSSTCC
ncbi:hypothetical protein HHK36_024094 [Tetracentron sinense]|uniref:NAB domain-containing protein n=1 Tax=Tetracentron sinense TaxID=13715 RepID=A0A835D3Y4_TETSI|nr:hypothetical protein HHK36_024094 [Tetracentron sinense]